MMNSSQFQAFADNIAKTLIDLETDFVSNIANNSPTAATIISGQFGASNSLDAHVQALAAGDQTGFVGKNWFKTATKVQSYVETTNIQLYPLVADILVGLEVDLGGVYSFMFANSVEVHPEFAAAFNYMAANSLASGYGPTVDKIPFSMIFPSSEITLGSIAETGAAAGTFTPNLPVAPVLGHTGASTSLLAGVYTVGVTFVTAAGETLVGPTATVTISAGDEVQVSALSGIPAGVTQVNYYMSQAAGGTVLGLSNHNSNGGAINLTALGAAATPVPALNTSGLGFDGTKYAPQELWLKNTAGGPTSGTATSFTVTYIGTDGGSHSVTKSLSGALASGAYLDLTVVGTAVTNIVVNSGGVAADALAVVNKVLRAVTY